MTFPITTTEFTGWRPSFINFQMCSTNPMDSINIHWNQLNTKRIADSLVYNYPVFSMNNYTPFFGNTNYNTLLDPSLAVVQTWWKSNNPNNGWGGFNNTAFGNMDFSKLWGNFNSSGNSSSSIGDDRTKTEEQISYQRKYNKLLSLMKQLKESDAVSQSEKDAIDAAIIADNENSKGEWKDKFNALKKVYDEKIDDKHIKKHIINSMTMGTKESPDADEVFKVRLTDAGFEYRSTEVDTKLNALKTAIDELSDSNPTISNGLIGALDIESSETNILDIISSWNSERENLNVGNKRIMAYIADKYNDSKIKDESKEEIKTSLVKPLYLSLINKAQDLANQLEGEEIDNLTKAITALTNEYGKLDKNMSTSFVQAFDTLYVATRWAAIKVIAKDADKYYGAIDSMFNSELFDEDTKKDLKSEGFSDTEISAQKVNYNAIDHGKVDGGNNDDDSDDYGETPEEQIEYLKKEGLIETLENKTYTNGGVIYRETTPTGEDGKARLFIIKDGKLYELTNPSENANGKYSAEALKEVDAETIKDYKDDKIAAEEKAKEEAEEKKAVEVEKQKTQAFEDGITVTLNLCGNTKNKDAEEIAKILQTINKDNVLEFFKGAFKGTNVEGKSGEYKIEGIIEKLTDDCKRKHVTTDMIADLVQAFLDKAEEMGLKDTKEYGIITTYLKKAKTEGFDASVTRKEIKGINRYFDKKAIDINFMAWSYSVCEVIDDMIKLLYQKMTN